MELLNKIISGYKKGLMAEKPISENLKNSLLTSRYSLESVVENKRLSIEVFSQTAANKK